MVTTATAPQAQVESVVRAHAGDDAEVQVIAPASKISWLDRLTNAEDDARADATERPRPPPRSCEASRPRLTAATSIRYKQSKMPYEGSLPTKSSS